MVPGDHQRHWLGDVPGAEDVGAQARVIEAEALALFFVRMVRRRAFQPLGVPAALGLEHQQLADVVQEAAGE